MKKGLRSEDLSPIFLEHLYFSFCHILFLSRKKMKFLKFLFKAKSLNAVVGKSIDMLDGAWWRGLMSAAQQIGFCFFTFSRWYHPPTTHLSHSTQFVTFFQSVGRIGATLTVLMCSSGSQTRNCLQFLQYYLYISHCQSSLSTPLPSKEEKLLKTHWYCLALTMTYYIENIYLELKVLLF